MLINFKPPRTLTFECNNCENEYTVDIPKEYKTAPRNEEFGGLENLETDPCPSCGAYEILNMNFPLEDKWKADNLPERVKNQHKHIRLFIKMYAPKK